MSVTSVGASSSQGAVARAGLKQEITRDDFLKLLIAQLQNQDPLSPMDNQEFAVQLATFNSLEQLMGVNEKLDSLQNKQLMTSQLNSASLIGKQISAHGDQLILDEKGSADAHYELAANAAKVTVRVLDSSGQMVRQIEAANQQAGEGIVRWDGRDHLGKSLPPGIYRFEVNAVDGGGKSIASAKQTRGVVTGLNLQGAEPILEIGSLQIPLSAVTQVR